MRKFAKTIVFALIGGLAVPIGALSGLCAIGCLLIWFFAPPQLGRDALITFAYTAPVCFISIWILVSIQKRGQRLIDEINRKHGLHLNPAIALGFPNPAFLVFDTKSQKIAACNSSTGDYKIHPLSYLLAWNYEWRDVEHRVFSGPGRQVPGTNLNGPNFERVWRREGFTLVLEVADENHPILKFPMSEQRAQVWCAKLNAMFHSNRH